MGYTTAREVNDLEAVRARTGAPQVVLIGHSWGARFAAAYAQEHPDRVAALVLTTPGDLPLEGAEVPPGDLTTRLDTSELVKEYLRLLGPRNLFGYALTMADARVAHSIATAIAAPGNRFAGSWVGAWALVVEDVPVLPGLSGQLAPVREDVPVTPAFRSAPWDAPNHITALLKDADDLG